MCVLLVMQLGYLNLQKISKFEGRLINSDNHQPIPKNMITNILSISNLFTNLFPSPLLAIVASRDPETKHSKVFKAHMK